MFSDEAALKRGIEGCDFASNLQANVLYCQKGQLVLQRALDLKVIIQYELPTEIQERAGTGFGGMVDNIVEEEGLAASNELQYQIFSNKWDLDKSFYLLSDNSKLYTFAEDVENSQMKYELKASMSWV